jgi:hypothetical protein
MRFAQGPAQYTAGIGGFGFEQFRARGHRRLSRQPSASWAERRIVTYHCRQFEFLTMLPDHHRRAVSKTPGWWRSFYDKQYRSRRLFGGSFRTPSVSRNPPRVGSRRLMQLWLTNSRRVFGADARNYRSCLWSFNAASV